MVGTLGHAWLVWWRPHTIIKVILSLHWLSYCLQIYVPTPSSFPEEFLVLTAKMWVVVSSIDRPNRLSLLWTLYGKSNAETLVSFLFLPVIFWPSLAQGTLGSRKEAASTVHYCAFIHIYLHFDAKMLPLRPKGIWSLRFLAKMPSENQR